MIPRCQECKRIHDLRSDHFEKYAGGGFLCGLVIGLLGVIIFAIFRSQNYNSTIIGSCFFYFIIILSPIILFGILGCLLDIITRPKLPAGVKPVEHKKNSPTIKEKIDDDWQLGETPSKYEGTRAVELQEELTGSGITNQEAEDLIDKTDHHINGKEGSQETEEVESPSKGAFGGPVGTIAFIIMIIIVIPFIKSQLGHDTPISPEHLKKLKKMSSESSSRNEVPVRRRQEKLSQSLPADGIYSDPQGSGGSYKDPVHGFFEVEPPKRFKAKERRDKTTTRLDNGTYVPCSRVNFKSGDAQIGVVTRKSPRGTIDTDIEVVLRNYKRSGVTVDKKRSVQIDGVRGYEVLCRIKNLKLLLVKYKKYGLDHAITISCSPADFSKLQKEFTDFLRSYRSIKP